MKKIIILSGLTAILFTSCYHEDPVYSPQANFSVDYTNVLPGEVVNFYNNSVDADSYQWDFGDGFVTNEANPIHTYENEGNYTVRLAAYSHNEVDYRTMTIEVIETTLEITVVEWTTGDLITNATVTLYYTWPEWVNFDNKIISANTDKNGVVVFKGLDTRPYYIDVWDSYSGASNEALGYEDVDFIKTLPLEIATYNTFTASVDYPDLAPKKAAIGSNSGQRVRNPVIKEVKRSFKDKPAYILNKK